MAAELGDSSAEVKEANGEELVRTLSAKINYLKKQIQAERVVFVKEKVKMNRRRIRSRASEVLLATERTDAESNNLLNSRMRNPVSTFTGNAQGYGHKDSFNCHESMVAATTKLQGTRTIPPYTSWIFLDRNQRMAEDQSVVGRRRIYYDNHHDGEALICSDSEEEVAEPEEEKHDFSWGEDRILWMAFEEHGLNDEVADIVSLFVKGSPTEIQERYTVLKEKYTKEQECHGSEEKGSGRRICLDKSLSDALDSFDNLFCRRCMVFDCRLHGCSQTIMEPREKCTYVHENGENEKPCSDDCYLPPLMVIQKGSFTSSSPAIGMKREESDQIVGCSTVGDQKSCGTVLISEPANGSELVATAPNEGAVVKATTPDDTSSKRKLSMQTNTVLEGSSLVISDSECSFNKKQKFASLIDIGPRSSELIQISDSDRSDDDDDHIGGKKEIAVEIIDGDMASSSQCKQLESLTETHWRPIEKELYLKGVEMFGKNSCLISRNLLSGWKTCKEVFSYMHENGASTHHNCTLQANSSSAENEKTDNDNLETSTKSRLFRKRGKTKKLKYSWKSAGHPSFWKRIVDGKNQSCKQYTPCECQLMCGKECSCMQNETCCEKYCGCSKNCKNRFRGCQCAKSQCRSRQCPCFAAGRECDPDVCRNCWVSCGDGSLGEPLRKGDGQCGNMRLLLRQQQKILLGKSDVAGWGAFIKNPVNKNDYLGEYTGELISHREADKRGKIYDLANSSFLFDLNDQYVLDACRKGDKLKFANHSPHPNCYAQVILVAGDHRVGIFAKERIEAGDELFYDYRYGPDQAPDWALKPESSKRDDTTLSQGRAKKHQSH